MIIEQEIDKEDKETKEHDGWIKGEKETILLYGPPKCGKTWAYCSIIEEVVNNNGTTWIINTDAGVSKTFKQYFESKSDEFRKKINYYFISDIQEIFPLVKKLKVKVKENDLIVIDLISDFWEMAQNRFMEEASGGDIVGFIRRMSEDKKTFGLFDGMKWQYIKRLDSYIIDNLVTTPPCNIVGVAAQKDLEVEKAITGRVKNPEYQAAGAKPAGQPTLAYRFNTIVFIGKEGDKYYFQIMGDRGAVTDQKMVTYGKNFWKAFLEKRRKKY